MIKDIAIVSLAILVLLAFIAGYFTRGNIKTGIPQMSYQYITNEIEKVRTVYFPITNDTERYTNLYSYTTNVFNAFTNQIDTFQPFFGIGICTSPYYVNFTVGVEYGKYLAYITAAYQFIGVSVAYKF